jgi:flagellar hook-associated protein 1 FlgK
VSLLAALSASLSGLDAARRNVQLAAHNAANVHTDGYSRKKLDQTQRVVDGQGMGVDASAVQRMADDYLSRELRLQKGALSSDQVIADMHDRLQTVLFGPPGQDGYGVPQKLAALAAALESFANQPDTVTARTTALAAITDFASAVDSAGRLIQSLRKEVDERIAELVGSANRDLLALHALNLEVARGGVTPDLLDQRDRLLDSLAEKIEISVAQLDRGTIAVYARGGVALVEYGAKQLVYTPAASVAADTVFGPISVYETSHLDPTSGKPKPGTSGVVLVEGGQVADTPIRSGRLAGLLKLRDHILPNLAGQYDELAELARFALNAAHNEAWPVPPPQQLVGTRANAASSFDAASRSGTAYAAVVDRASGATVATIALDLTQNASDLLTALNAGLGGYGTAAFDSSGALSISLADGYGIALTSANATITETDSEGRSRSYGFAHYFGLNDLLVRSPARASELALAPALAAESWRLGQARVDVAGSPPVATLGGVGDHRGALGLGAALTTAYATITRGGLDGRPVDVRTYAADIAAVAARAAADAARAADNRGVLVDDLAARRSAVSGVSLDEELARLTLYQQSYAASARILAVVDEMLSELMQVLR